MKAKFGSIVVAGSGKIGGHVASRNRAGAYFRTKVTPVNPASIAQQNVRSRMASLSQAWRALAAVERAAWNSAVSDFSKTNVFGDMVNPSGFSLFMALNNNLLNIGESQIDTPPVPQSVLNATSFTCTSASGAHTLSLTFSPAIAATEKVLIFATPPQSPGKGFVKSEYRQIGVLNVANTSPFSAATMYVAKYGSIGPAGQKIFVKLVPVSLASGQQGIAIAASCITAS